MARRNYQKRILPALALGTAAWMVLRESGPVVDGGEVNAIPAMAACLLALSGFRLLADAFRLAGDVLDWQKARTPTGLKGTGGFVKRLREIKDDLEANVWGPYWGALNGEEIIADFASNALTIGPAGSGKGVGVVQPTILSIRESKTIIDFKGELACVLAGPLRARGERVIFLNLGDVWTEILGASDFYNPLSVILDDFLRAGGLRDISDDVQEKNLQLYPETNGGKSDNTYFHDGSRTLIGFAIVISMFVDGEDTTLGHVAALLNDRQSLLHHALWAAGRLEREDGALCEMKIAESPWAKYHDACDVADFSTYFKGVASSIANLLAIEDSRTAEAFLTGAQQALARFNITTRVHAKTSRTTFRFAEQKEGDRPTTVFIVVDASRINAQKQALGLIQWCMFTELKRHANKQRPVYLIADEATNFKLHDLGSLLTWGRGYGLRLHLIIQSFSAFRRVYGQDVLNTLLSETEIKQFLPGQREPETLAAIEKLLGERSVIVQSHRGNIGGAFGVDGFDFREESRALMTADEIRRTDNAILVVRRNKPLLTNLPPIAAIDPWRDEIDINPFHGKPFLLPIKLRLKRRRAKGRQA